MDWSFGVNAVRCSLYLSMPVVELSCARRGLATGGSNEYKYEEIYTPKHFPTLACTLYCRNKDKIKWPI